METIYHRAVKAQSKRQLLKKIASEPEPERFEIPSVHRMDAQRPFKDRKLVVPNMSAPQFLCDNCSGGRVSGGSNSGGKISWRALAKTAGETSKNILRYGAPAVAGTIGTVEGGPAVGLASAKAASELAKLVTGGKVGGRSSGGRNSGGASTASTDKRKERGQMVSKLMREKGMTLGQASAYIKANKA